MKIIFMGTPDFATGCLEALIKNGHEIALVVTQPDKPKGRGHKLTASPVKECALKYGLDVYQPNTLKTDEAFDKLSSFNADLFVVVAFGQILTEKVLNIPRMGCVNVHASLLPKYRGAAPIQWSIICGEEKTGITTMFMDKGVDTGDIILKQEVIMENNETAETLHDKLAVLGADTLIKTMKLFEEGNVIRKKQNDALSCYAPMIDKNAAKIDFSKSAIEIYNLVRGMNSYPLAQTFYNGKLMKVASCIVKSGNFTGENGEIIGVSEDGILVKCGENAIEINEIQMEGKKRMRVSDYIKGNSFTIGYVFD